MAGSVGASTRSACGESQARWMLTRSLTTMITGGRLRMTRGTAPNWPTSGITLTSTSGGCSSSWLSAERCVSRDEAARSSRTIGRGRLA